MHEASIASALLDLIETTARTHGATRVISATVQIGALSTVVPDALEFAFEVARRDTVAADCALLAQVVPLRVSCPQCGAEGEAELYEPRCGHCGASPVHVTGGRELRLVSIDVDDDGE